MTKQELGKRRATLQLGAVLLIAVAIVGTAVTSASAKAPKPPKPPKFAGAAPDGATCSVSAKVSFSPPLTTKGGGTNPSRVKAKLSGCSTTNAAISIKKAKLTGSFASSPLNCVTQSTTGASASLTIKWKGAANGTIGGTAYAGKAHFTSTSVSDATATGSFAGNASMNLPFPASAGPECASKRGIKKLTLTGTITLGPTCSLVASTTPAVNVLNPPPSSLKNHGFTSTTEIPLVCESQHTLATPLKVDTDSPGLVTTNAQLPNPSPTVAGGTCVDSFILQLDANGVAKSLSGSVTFRHKILGVEVQDASLDASDFLGSPTTTYPSHPSAVDRGIELIGNQHGGPPDSFTLNSTLTNLAVNLNVTADYDQVRVIVACAPS